MPRWKKTNKGNQSLNHSHPFWQNSLSHCYETKTPTTKGILHWLLGTKTRDQQKDWITLPETNIKRPWKFMGWETILSLLGKHVFRYVSFRECKSWQIFFLNPLLFFSQLVSSIYLTKPLKYAFSSKKAQNKYNYLQLQVAKNTNKNEWFKGMIVASDTLYPSLSFVVSKFYTHRTASLKRTQAT